MAKKSTTIGEFIITIDDDKSVSVSRIYRSTMAALKIIAKKKGFDVDPKWNTQRLGKLLLDNFCDGERTGTIGEYVIEREDSGRINVLQTYNNTIEALRQCSKACGFEYDPKWNTQTFGNKLVTAAENGTLGEIAKPKSQAETNDDDEKRNVEEDKIEQSSRLNVDENILELCQELVQLMKEQGREHVVLVSSGGSTYMFEPDVEEDVFNEEDAVFVTINCGDYGRFLKLAGIILEGDNLKFYIVEDQGNEDGQWYEGELIVNDIDQLMNNWWGQGDYDPDPYRVLKIYLKLLSDEDVSFDDWACGEGEIEYWR